MIPGRRSGPAPLPETAPDEVAAAVSAIVQPLADLDQRREQRTELVAIVRTFGDNARRTPYVTLEPARRAVERAHRRGIEVSIEIYDLTALREAQTGSEAAR